MVRTTVTTYYIARVDKRSGREEFLQDDGRELYRPTPNTSGATRYTDRQKVAQIINHLNGDAEAKEGNCEYFLIQSIDDERKFIDNLSEEAKAHFDTGEEDSENESDNEEESTEE